MINIGVLKCGSIALSGIFELLLDERANRENVSIRVFGAGSKMGEEEVESLMEDSRLSGDIDLFIFISPNLSNPGPKNAMHRLSKLRKPVIFLSDGPKKADAPQNLGYIIVPCDPMMGVRREFLDPTEMMFFNADALKVLAGTGTARMIIEKIDGVIQAIDEKREYGLPRLVIKKEDAIEHAKYDNPYAKAKALAAFDMAERAGEMNVEGCFKKDNREEYIPIVACAHEMLRHAAMLCDEAREIEKSNDDVARFPHRKSGATLEKRRLMEKPPK